MEIKIIYYNPLNSAFTPRYKIKNENTIMAMTPITPRNDAAPAVSRDDDGKLASANPAKTQAKKRYAI